jgi:hypothetical protein
LTALALGRQAYAAWPSGGKEADYTAWLVRDIFRVGLDQHSDVLRKLLETNSDPIFQASALQSYVPWLAQSDPTAAWEMLRNSPDVAQDPRSVINALKAVTCLLSPSDAADRMMEYLDSHKALGRCSDLVSWLRQSEMDPAAAFALMGKFQKEQLNEAIYSWCQGVQPAGVDIPKLIQNYFPAAQHAELEQTYFARRASEDPLGTFPMIDQISDPELRQSYRAKWIKAAVDNPDAIDPAVLRDYIASLPPEQREIGNLNVGNYGTPEMFDIMAMLRVDGEFNEDQQSELAVALRQLSIVDPEASLAWNGAHVDLPGADFRAYNLVEGLMYYEASLAFQFLNELPPGPVKDSGITNLVTYGRDDPSLVIPWALQAADPEIRTTLMTDIYRDWLERDQEGALSDLAAQVGLSPEERAMVQENLNKTKDEPDP